MAVIREDKYGLYVKAGGYIFRPIFPVGYQHVHCDGTQLRTRDKVKATHRSGTGLATVTGDGIKETWYNHGDYLGNPDYINSESCYKPSHNNW